MDNSCSFYATNESFAELLLKESDNNYRPFQHINPICSKMIGEHYRVTYTNTSNIKRETLAEIGYSSFPTLYSIEEFSNSSMQSLEKYKFRNMSGIPLLGKDILIGFVDTGIDYTKNSFLNIHGKTRIYSIWDQSITAKDDANVPYGSEYTHEHINSALSSDDPLNIVPSMDFNGHGTMMASISAGSPIIDNDFTGIATDSELVVVKLKQAKKYIKDFFLIPDDSICYQENNIMDGIEYLTNTAKKLNKPIVICIGLGTNQGSHKGRGFLNDYITHLTNLKSVYFVISGGNEGYSRHHFFSNKSENGYSTMDMNIAKNEAGFSLEIWGNAKDLRDIEVVSPMGQRQVIPPIVGPNIFMELIYDQSMILVDRIIETPNGDDELILLRFMNPVQGVWKLHIYDNSERINEYHNGFHAWLPLSNFIKQDTVFLNSNSDTTITPPGNTYTAITVTAYNVTNGMIFEKSGRGFTATHSIKPELVASGVNVLVPSVQDTYSIVSGSSVAASFAAGVVVILIEWFLIQQQQRPTISEIKKTLFRCATRNPNMDYPNPVWGYGIINAYQSIVDIKPM